MPQMAPLSWLMLFSFFTIMLVVIMILNYYLYVPTIESKEETSINQEKMNWKW